MKKTGILTYALIAIVGLTNNEAIAQKKAPSKSSKPNVIIIYTDDQGTLDLNIYGAKDLQTPNIDKLARNGVRFSQFYSASPICSPSRASLLSGRYPQRAGLVDNASGSYGVGGGMPGSQFTMAEMFKTGGYKTAHIGKWHMGYTPETMPNQQGFDYSWGFMGGCIDNFSHFYYWGGPNRHDLWRNGKEIYEPGKRLADRMVEEAGDFMKQNKSEPFFMYFAINIPHYPLQPDVKWLEYYKNLPSPRNMYAAFVSTMDERIGQLLKKVNELGLTDNTIIVFQADQGHSEEDRAFGGGGFAGPYRGSKFSVFEGGIRVPAIISWPGHIAKDQVRDQFAANIDWYPTLAEYCGLQLPDRKLDGKSITKIIASNTAGSPHPIFFWQSSGSKENPQWAVREGDWKLLHNPLQASPNELPADKLMLINMKNDSSERRNEAEKNPEIVARLKQQYLDWIGEVKNQ
jgi:arylsulfatase A